MTSVFWYDSRVSFDILFVVILFYTSVNKEDWIELNWMEWTESRHVCIHCAISHPPDYYWGMYSDIMVKIPMYCQWQNWHKTIYTTIHRENKCPMPSQISTLVSFCNTLHKWVQGFSLGITVKYMGLNIGSGLFNGLSQYNAWVPENICEP